jgi:hypothetical protein
MKKSMFTAGASTAALLALNLAVFAQAPAPAQPPSQEPTAQAPARKVTVTGCVQSEADYRKAKNLGRGGAASTGVGVGDEFVIINASSTPASSPGAPAEPAPTATAGAGGAAYEVTGSAEEQLKQHAGKRVEIIGTIKPAETTTGKPTGGVDPMGQDLRLPELEIATVRAATGECPMR